MNDTPPVGITVRDRIHRVLDIFADEVGPRLLQHPSLTSVEFETNGRRTITVGQMRADGGKLDAAECCNIILNAPESLFEDVRQVATDLKHLRNRVAHPKRVFVEVDAVSAASWVVRLLQRFGRTEAARMAERYRVGPTIRYVTALRKYLIGIARKPDGLVSYEQALDAMSKALPAITMGAFLRQLNVLAALQMILGEPQLCALVVLADRKVPGDGFYWTINVNVDDPVEKKVAAHKKEAKAVRRFKWPDPRDKDEGYALPWSFSTATPPF
jgi:hypothetical protein